jgi:hypothetical protein
MIEACFFIILFFVVAALHYHNNDLREQNKTRLLMIKMDQEQFERELLEPVPDWKLPGPLLEKRLAMGKSSYYPKDDPRRPGLNE